jgi:hypothetical protein
MTNSLRFFGKRLIHRTATSKKSPLRGLNPRKGYNMMLDLDVSAGKKILAIGVGVLFTGALVLLEVPLDLFVAALPGVGLAVDFLANSFEAVAVPLLIACMVLPRIVDAATLERFEG